ncbi:MAG: UDP-N-acetylmuramoyl-L-alanyl-D-glutamate--2,6-diaminopimelate ligase [Alphaproteobacteria bacterium]|nr:UDP-N-acetylmuramoyl-L-alanyl-D-glutamate--2,6-diaminopimelate ligase [Alphaproteobacteria bacterium]
MTPQSHSTMASIKGFAGLTITGLASDSRKVKPGYLFAALAGTKTDGARFVKDAVARGAVAVLGAPVLADDVAALGVRFIPDENPRAGLARYAAAFFASQPDIVAAVTGTKGKSSIVAFLREIWTALGKSAASLGTVGVTGPNGTIPLSHTTPDPVEIHELLATLKADGVDHLALEASSHGLDQHRLDGVRIKGCGFTTITRDHMDYHPTFEDYLTAKLRLFSEVVADGGVAVINADADHADRFIAAAQARGLKLITVGRKGETIQLDRREDRGGAQALTLHYQGKIYYVELPQAGAFQASNALVAAGLAIGLGEDSAKVFAALEHLKGAPGRMEKVAFAASGAPVYVDYAHTPDSLEKVLEALRPHTAGRLHVVFGCGGDRDKGKRPLMGAAAVKLADDVIVTDDNPRTEDAATIRAAILAAAPGAREIGDRAEAIRAAMADLKTGDVLIIAGKGHETGQYIKGEVFPFSDREQAIAAALALGGRAT